MDDASLIGKSKHIVFTTVADNDCTSTNTKYKRKKTEK